jgi:hypothetical protein
VSGSSQEGGLEEIKAVASISIADVDKESIMENNSWQVLEQVSGVGKATILKGLLEAQGIQVILSQEGIGENIYPVSVGPLSEIQILVHIDQLEEAQLIVVDYNAGAFENLSYPDPADPQENEEKTTGQG